MIWLRYFILWVNCFCQSDQRVGR